MAENLSIIQRLEIMLCQDVARLEGSIEVLLQDTFSLKSVNFPPKSGHALSGVRVRALQVLCTRAVPSNKDGSLLVGPSSKSCTTRSEKHATLHLRGSVSQRG